MINANIRELLNRSFTGIILLICFGGAYLHSSTLFSLLLCGVLIEILIYEWPKLVPLFSLFTLLYPILPFTILLWLVNSYHATDIYLPLYPFLIAWTADTCGYVIGKLAGKHKIYPSLSPGKSWEGLAGSITGVFIMNLLILPRINILSSSFVSRSILSIFTFSIIMASIALLGGFFMSYLKRKNHLKDAGDLLPGHGGFLDRFDSVLFVTIAITLLIVIVFLLDNFTFL